MSREDVVRTAARTLDLFEAFAEAGAPLSLTELAQRTGVPISSCHALMRTLQARGYVYVLDGRKRVYPTKKLAMIAEAIVRQEPILERLSPILSRLAKETGETVIVGKIQGSDVVYLDVVEGSHTVRYAAEPGLVRPAHSSALGKSTLGLLDDGELPRAICKLKLTRVTDATITDPSAFEADITAARKRGYFVSRGETVSDVMGISIARRIAEEPYGIGVAGPIYRLELHLERYVKALREAGRKIEEVDRDLRGDA